MGPCAIANDTPTTDGRETIERPLREGWVIVTALSGVLGVLNAVAVVFLLIAGEWFGAALGVLTIVGLYWFAAGAWLRTPWGHHSERTPPPAPPSLSEGRARVYVAVGELCVIACLIALALQAIAGDW